MTEAPKPLVNQPVDPLTQTQDSQEIAQEAQEQFIPQVKPDHETQDHLLEKNQPDHQKETNWDRLVTKYFKTVQKIVVWGLMAQGLFGIWQSIAFILIEIPEKQQLLSQGLISQQEANSLASQAIMMIISAAISMVFALRLRAIQSKVAQKIETAIGIILFLANTWIMNFLNSQGSAEIIGRAFESFLGVIR